MVHHVRPGVLTVTDAAVTTQGSPPPPLRLRTDWKWRLLNELFAAFVALLFILAAALVLLGVLILATLPLFARRRRVKQAPGLAAAAGEGVGLIDQSVGQAMQRVGPLTLLAIAFIAGLLASRRR